MSVWLGEGPGWWGLELGLTTPVCFSRSFVLSSLGFTAVAFVTGALALWAPAFLQRARLAAGAPPADDRSGTDPWCVCEEPGLWSVLSWHMCSAWFVCWCVGDV